MVMMLMMALMIMPMWLLVVLTPEEQQLTHRQARQLTLHLGEQRGLASQNRSELRSE